MKKLVSYFHIVLHLNKMTLEELVTFVLGLKLTGDPDAIAPPFTQAQLQTLANKVLSDLGIRITTPNPTLTAAQQIDVDALCRALIAVKNYVEQVANAHTPGNRAMFDTIVRRIGFMPQGANAKHIRIFEAKPNGAGSFSIITPSAGKGKHAVYVFQLGVTTAKDVLPLAWQDMLPIPVTELIVTNAPSGAIIAVHYAEVIVSTHKKTGGTTTTITPPASGRIRPTNSLSVSKAGKITYVYGTPFLHYSDVIYIIVP